MHWYVCSCGECTRVFGEDQGPEILDYCEFFYCPTNWRKV